MQLFKSSVLRAAEREVQVLAPPFGDGVFFGDELVLDITELMQGGTEKDRMEIQDVFPGPNDSDGYEQALVKRYCAGPVPGPLSHKVCTEAPLVPGPSPP